MALQRAKAIHWVLFGREFKEGGSISFWLHCPPDLPLSYTSLFAARFHSVLGGPLNLERKKIPYSTQVRMYGSTVW